MDRDRVNRRMEALVRDYEVLLDEAKKSGIVLRNEVEYKARIIDYRIFIVCCKMADRVGRETYNKVSAMSVPEQEIWLMNNSPYLKSGNNNKPSKIGGLKI